MSHLEFKSRYTAKVTHIMFQNRTFCIISPKQLLKSQTVTMYCVNVINAEHYDIDDKAENPKIIVQVLKNHNFQLQSRK